MSAIVTSGAAAEAPAGYPAQEESDVVLKSGSTLRLRPIRPEDAPALLAFYERLSPDSLYFRFFSVPQLNVKKAESICRVDYQNTFALVGESAGRIVAVGHFFRNKERPERAEAAFTVEDALQGQGIGTRLLERLAEIARARGIQVFEAEVLAQNRRMIGVFRNCGFELKQTFEGGVGKMVFSLTPTPRFEERYAERSERAAAASMKLLFEPKVVAVLGASRERGKIGAELFFNLVSNGFQGTIVPINPNADEILGLRCYPRLEDYPGPVDLAVIVIPAAKAEAAVDECVAKGVKAIIMITAGFSETGTEGRLREAALLEKIRAAGIRMVGPNSMGLINTDPKVRLDAQFGPVHPPEGRVALSSQSGALGLALLDYASKLNLGISTFVSVGNKADVSGNDLIQYWSEDPRTDVILLYLESFGNPVRFSRIARRVARKKPIIAVKAGRSSAGSRAATSHTGALAESDPVVDALFRQAGVIRTGTLEELFDVATLLAHQPVPLGRRVGILTNAGGPGILAADACEAQGLELPLPVRSAAAKLRAFLPAGGERGQPGGHDRLGDGGALPEGVEDPAGRGEFRQRPGDLHPADREPGRGRRHVHRRRHEGGAKARPRDVHERQGNASGPVGGDSLLSLPGIRRDRARPRRRLRGMAPSTAGEGAGSRGPRGRAGPRRHHARARGERRMARTARGGRGSSPRSGSRSRRCGSPATKPPRPPPRATSGFR